MWPNLEIPPFVAKLLITIRLRMVEGRMLQGELCIAAVLLEAVRDIAFVALVLHVPFCTLFGTVVHHAALPQARITIRRVYWGNSYFAEARLPIPIGQLFVLVLCCELIAILVILPSYIADAIPMIFLFLDP